MSFKENEELIIDVNPNYRVQLKLDPSTRINGMYNIRIKGDLVTTPHDTLEYYMLGKSLRNVYMSFVDSEVKGLTVTKLI